MNNIVLFFLEASGYSKDMWVLVLDNAKYGIKIKNKLLLRSYKDEKIEKTLEQLTKEVENDGFEWGILIHQKGIWLLKYLHKKRISITGYYGIDGDFCIKFEKLYQ